MDDRAGQFGHGHSLNRADRRPAGPVCGRVHPLLEDVRCQRLRGHPGRHGAYLDTASAEATVQWDDDEERAG